MNLQLNRQLLLDSYKVIYVDECLLTISDFHTKSQERRCMKVAVAIDSFKDGASNKEINDFLKNNLEFSGVIKYFKMADGGEGALDALCDKFVAINTIDALQRPITAQVGILDDEQHIYVVEMARCVGLQLLTQDERDAMKTSTFGFGNIVNQLITKYRARTIILTVGGSATNDMGFGFIQALGAEFFNKNGEKISDVITPEVFPSIYSVNYDKLVEISVNFHVLSDVTNPLLGLCGCSHVFGPQKGLSMENIILCDAQMRRLIGILGFSEREKDGAAGGIVYTLRNLLNATVTNGAEFILERQNFQQETKCFDLLITGEGCLDAQTAFGKAVYVASKLFIGQWKVGIFGKVEALGTECDLDEVIDINQHCIEKSLEEKLKATKENILQAVKSIIDRFKDKIQSK